MTDAQQDSASGGQPRFFAWIRSAQGAGTAFVRRAVAWLLVRTAPVGMLIGLVIAWALRDLKLTHVPDYLGTVVALETTAVAIMVPVVIDVAFRTYEEYRSREVRAYLLKEPSLTWLVTATFVNALAAVAAQAAFSWLPASPLFVPLSVYATLQALVLVMALLQYLYVLRDRILSEPDWLIDKLTDDALSVLPE